MQFPDGCLPSKDLIKKWLTKVDEFFSQPNPSQNNDNTTPPPIPTNTEE